MIESFVTHLRSYLALFRALPRFEFLYMAPTARLFPTAQAEFNRNLYGSPKQADSVNILNYFRVRKAWDLKERVTSADVILLKEAQARYGGTTTDELYAKWHEGVARDEDIVRSIRHLPCAGTFLFRTLLCGSSLKVFSDPKGKTLESSTETGSGGCVIPVLA